MIMLKVFTCILQFIECYLVKTSQMNVKMEYGKTTLSDIVKIPNKNHVVHLSSELIFPPGHVLDMYIGMTQEYMQGGTSRHHLLPNCYYYFACLIYYFDLSTCAVFSLPRNR